MISRKYSDNTSDTYSYAGHTSDFTFNPDLSTALTTSNVSVTIGYGEKTCSQAITVNPARTLSSISISEYTTTFNQGDSFEFGGTVTANYSNSTTADVTLSAAFSGYNMTETGTQTITVSYTEGGVTKTATYSITIKAISSVTFVGGTDKGSTTGNNSQDEVIKSGIRMHCSDGAFATAEYRFYSGSILTFSSTIGNMKSISFSPASSNGDLSKLSLDSESPGSFTSSTGTWSGVSETVIFHLSAQVRATEVVIELGDVAKTLVSISVSDETTSFEVNDTFAFGGIVTATYDPKCTM